MVYSELKYNKCFDRGKSKLYRFVYGEKREAHCLVKIVRAKIEDGACAPLSILNE